LWFFCLTVLLFLNLILCHQKCTREVWLMKASSSFSYRIYSQPKPSLFPYLLQQSIFCISKSFFIFSMAAFLFYFPVYCGLLRMPQIWEQLTGLYTFWRGLNLSFFSFPIFGDFLPTTSSPSSFWSYVSSGLLYIPWNL